jgi:hypothetical protein
LVQMGCSKVTVVKRAFVKLLLSLASAYEVALQANRDSDDTVLLTAYKRVILKVHPDKGGRKKDFQNLQNAKEAWESARREFSKQAGRPGAPEDLAVSSTSGAAPAKGYRVQACAVLLTYFGEWTNPLWNQFLAFVRRQLVPWSVWRWCATLERSAAGKLHVHLQLQFRKVVDRGAKFFSWEGRCPNASPNDYLGEGYGGRKWQQSVDRAFFYVFADKEGTQRDPQGNVCVEGNHQPVWTKADSRYQVLGKWPEALWKQRKLSHAKYEEYLYVCRDGVLTRKRNLDAVRQKEEEEEEDQEREVTAKRVRANTFETFAEVPEATAWLALFNEEVDRYPFLVVLGPSRSRKTEFAKALFKAPLELKVGALDHFPDGMRGFCRKRHDGIVLDDVRDFGFLVRHQEKLQAKSDSKVEFASTPGGQLAYTKWLHRVPVVVTANFTTKNRHLLDEDDFLGNTDNRVLVNRTGAGVD